jgi:RES domain-containing protein
LPNLRFSEFNGIVWRHTAVVQPPLDMLLNASRGGRFNPPISFPMLYTSISVQGVKAEFIKSAKTFKVDPESLLPRMLHQVEVNLRKVVDLTDVGNRKFLGCSLEELIGDDWGSTQEIGTQLRYICDAILSYSAADPKHKNLNLYIVNPSSVVLAGSTKIQTMADWEHVNLVR